LAIVVSERLAYRRQFDIRQTLMPGGESFNRHWFHSSPLTKFNFPTDDPTVTSLLLHSNSRSMIG
jgi:hypothetical protein